VQRGEPDATVQRAFADCVRRHGAAVAVEEDERRLTYGELDAASSRLAHRLRERGLETGDAVAVLADRSLEAVVAFLAALKGGGHYVPLDPGYPDERLAFMLRDTSARVVVAHPSAADRARRLGLDPLVLDSALEALSGEACDPPAAAADARDLIYVMYTSGSTGRPKGVAVEQRSVLRLVLAATELAPEPGEGVLLVNRLTFDVSAFDIWSALLNGARLVVHGPSSPDPVAIGRTIERHDVGVACLPTGLFHQLVEGNLPALRRLRLLIAVGDVLSPWHAARAAAELGDCRVVNAYGPTEATILASAYTLPRGWQGASVPIGRPLPGTTLHVLDERRRPVSAGAAGELYVGGDAVARGYLNLPESTAERFVRDPFAAEPGSRLYRTGDRVRLRADGELEFVGRVDRQVKIRGYRVEPGEIEARLAEHPSVAQAIVVCREDVPGHRRLVGYVVAAPRRKPGEAELHSFLADRLPPYMLPSALVVLEELPLTATGKVDRDSLPDPAVLAAQRARESPPRTSLERRVAAVWREVLHLDDVGVDEDFFGLGGDSLLGLQVLVRLREDPGVELPLPAIFEARTVAALAARLEEHAGERPALPRLERAARASPIPASYAQAQACFFDELSPDAAPYQFQALIWLEGDLDVTALERALAEIVRRHEILRTTFVRAEGGWRQVIHDPFPLELPRIDLRGEADPAAALDELTREAFATRLDVGRLPLVRWTLARVGESRWALVDVEHHVVHDGWSFTVFLGELAEIYAACAEGRPHRLPEPEIQYADWAVWQRRLVESGALGEQLGFWTERLADPPPPPELGFDRPRPREQTFRGSSVRRALAPNVAAAARALACREGVTLFMTMLAAFLVLLARRSGRDDVLVGSGLANRRTRESEQLLGMLVNTVALRVDLAGDPTGHELLQRVREVTVDAYANQDVPFEQVVEALAPARSASHTPLYQALFSFHDSPLPELRLDRLSIAPEEVQSNGSAKADVNVVVINRRGGGVHGPPGEVTIVWEYSTDLFDRATAERMVDQYERLLHELVAEPERRVSELSWLGADERRWLLEELNATERPYEREASIAEVFAARALDSADRVAIVAEGTELTYAELNRCANRLAHRLRRLGIDRGSRVAVCLERSPEQVVALLGILKAGAAYVALEPDLPTERLGFICADAGVAYVCTRRRYRDVLAPTGRQLLELDALDLASEPDHDPPCASSAEDPAYVAYTSGSTGTPKGVEALQRGVVRLVRGVDYVDLGPDETVLGLAPLGFDASTFEVWGPLLNGGRLALAPPGSLSAAEIAAAVRRHSVTTVWLTAGLFHRMVDHELDALSEVRQLLAGGDVLSPAHVARALQALPAGGVLVNGYGPTEGTTFTCCHRLEAGSSIAGRIPIGRPIANTRVYVLDERGEPVPTGVPGELYIGGDGLAAGYVGDPKLTATRFVPDPFDAAAEGRLYRTGDLVRWRADGLLDFLGRLDRQVKIRGFRAEPGEVEQVLRDHPAVSDAAVVPHTFGPDDRRLVAYVVAAGGAGDLEGVRAYAASRLPSFLVPSAWVPVAALPLTPAGKVDHEALPAPEPARLPPRPRRREPGRLESSLITVWQEVLGVRPIGPDDDFFDLGGNSLLAVELFAAIERTTGARLPLASIFQARTVAELADVLRDEGWEAPWSPLVPLRTTGSRPPLFLVTAGDANVVGYGALARRLGPDQPFFALQPRGLHGRRPLDRRVERMAARYLGEVRKVQPHGPYLLGGRCLGGLVAFEMARRLDAAGERVALLVALDSLGPLWTERRLANGLVYDEMMSRAYRRGVLAGRNLGDPETEAGTEALLAWLQEPVVQEGDYLVNRYLHEVYLARPDVQAVFPKLTGKNVRRFARWAWTAGQWEMRLAHELLPPAGRVGRGRPPRARRRVVAPLRARAIEWADVLTGARLPGWAERHERRLERTAREAVLAYRAERYLGRVTLIRSVEFAENAYLERWHEVAREVEEHVVAGGHRSILREPDVAGLAECLDRCIDAALRTAPGRELRAGGRQRDAIATAAG
jgi:amino acid adenylation domain-containing protein